MMSHECKCTLSHCESGVVYYLRKPTFKGEAGFTPLSLRSYKYNSIYVEDNKEEVIEQYYVNEANQDVEAFYAVPIEKNMNMVTLNVEVEGNTISKVINRYKDDFEYIESNRYVIDWQEEDRSSRERNIFKMTVGHLTSGCGVKIGLKYSSRVSTSKSIQPKEIYQSVTNYCNQPLSHGSLSNGSCNHPYTDQYGVNEDEDENEDDDDDDHTRRWYDRPWGDFGKPWGDFGRPWKVNRRPWGQYTF